MMESTENVVFVGDGPVSDGAVDSGFLEPGGDSHSSPAPADPVEYHCVSWVRLVFVCVTFYYETNN